MMPRTTLTCVPSQRSAVSHFVPRTVADAYLPRVLKLPFPSPQSCRTMVAAVLRDAARLALRADAEVAFHEAKLDDRLLLVDAPEQLEDGRDAARAVELHAARRGDEGEACPFVTSTVAPNGIVPVVNGAPFTSTVPVAVPVGGAAAPPEPVVVVAPPPPPPAPPPPSGPTATTWIARGRRPRRRRPRDRLPSRRGCRRCRPVGSASAPCRTATTSRRRKQHGSGAVRRRHHGRRRHGVARPRPGRRAGSEG